MRSLVIGGTRFVGLHLVRLLHRRGHDVSVLNRGQTKVDLPAGVKRLYADRDDPSQVKAALGDASFDNVFDTSGYTAAGLTHFIDLLEGKTGLYVYCSTRSVYAPTDLSPVDEAFPLDRRPEAIDYVRGKVECEDALMDAFESRGFPATIMRPPYIYGPHDQNSGRGFSIFARLLQGRRIIVPWSGRTHTHFLHVDDFADAFLAAVGRPQVVGQAYNISGRHAITSNALVETIAEVMGVQAQIVHVPPDRYDKIDLPPFPFDWRESQVYNIEKAVRDLEWAPGHDLREGMATTYRWWLQQGLDKKDWDFSAEDELLAKYG